MLENLTQKLKNFLHFKAKPKANMTEAEKAWLASAIDGEGSIMKYIRKKTGATMICIMVCNTNRDYVAFAAKLFGTAVSERPARIIFEKKYGIILHAKTIYTAYLYGFLGLKTVLTQIMPYLIIKTEKAKHALEYINENPPKPPHYSLWLRLKNIGKEYGHIFIICPNCQKEFRIYLSLKGKVKCCSKKCRLEYYKKQQKQEI